MVIRYTRVPAINPSLPVVVVSLTYFCISDFYESLGEEIPSYILKYSYLFTQHMGNIQRTNTMDINLAYSLYLDFNRIVEKYHSEDIPPISFIRIQVWLESLSNRLILEDL